MELPVSQIITEDQIKKAALRFLKAYYRFRPRLDKTRTSIDLKSKDGIIADGYLTFPQEDGHNFVATIEASSKYTRKEVYFNLQKTLLIWDSIAIGGLLTAFLFSYGYAYDHFTIRQIGQLGTSLILLLAFALSFSIYYFFFRRLRRYRYIYAVEQFKKYHADEQWVAIGEDVFDQFSDAQYQELKNQCVYNGFGLITVDHQHEPHMLITPSRKELFKNKRSVLTFLEGSSSGRVFEMAKNVRSRYLQWFNNLFVRRNDNKKSLLRYQKTYINQVILTAVSIGIISTIYYKQMNERDKNYVDELVYEAQMQEFGKKATGESDFVPPDSLVTEPPRPFEEESQSSYQSDEEADAALFSSTDGPPGAESTEEDFALEEEAFAQKVVAVLEGDYVGYDCERFFNFEKSIFLIQFGLYDELEVARQRMEALDKAGFHANIIWLGCFSRQESAYILYFEMMFESKTEANANARKIRNRLKRKKIRPKQFTIRTISRK
ncbi:MAG: hypothetical protein AAF990_24950 [Bacteroidota bacterium]